MKIFLTGGCGFIGSNFILKQISTTNNTILNYDKITYAGSNDNLNSITKHKNYEFIEGDICDIKSLSSAVLTFQPNCIINFAAESHVDRSIDNPMTFINTNILGTGVLLEVLRKYYSTNSEGDFKFIHVSTDEVYGSLDKHGLFTENHIYNPSSPYSASKASSDHLVSAWNKTYGLPTIVINCSNNFGPYQFIEKLIPLIIVNYIDEKLLPIYGKGLNVRDWLYVEDHCDALVKILDNGTIGESYNIGGNNEMRNIDIVTNICLILDELNPRKNGVSYKKLITYVEDRPGHDYRYAIDSTKIIKKTGWQPKHTFEAGLKKTIQWYLENEDWWRKIQKNNYSQGRLGLRKRNNNS